MGWLMTGQLIQVTLRDGREPKSNLTDTSDTNTETDQFTTTTEDDDEDYFEPAARHRSESPEPQDIIIGRVYSYDSTYKLLILKTVQKAGTAEETFSDSVMINARNIKHCEIVEYNFQEQTMQ